MSVEGFKRVYKIHNHQIYQLARLYRQTRWANGHSLDDVKKIVRGSSMVFGIVDERTNELIAFGRILTDFIKHGYIEDVIVDKNYRGKGIGKMLIESIINHRKIKKLDELELACRERLIPFYKQFGFRLDDYVLMFK